MFDFFEKNSIKKAEKYLEWALSGYSEIQNVYLNKMKQVDVQLYNSINQYILIKRAKILSKRNDFILETINLNWLSSDLKNQSIYTQALSLNIAKNIVYNYSFISKLNENKTKELKNFGQKFDQIQWYGEICEWKVNDKKKQIEHISLLNREFQKLR